MRPLLVIDGKPTRYFHLETCVTMTELLPDPVTLTKRYKPGQHYMIVWHLNGTRELIPGAAIRTVRPSGRPMLSIGRHDASTADLPTFNIFLDGRPYNIDQLSARLGLRARLARGDV